MAKILLCAVALATLCMVMAKDSHIAKATTNRKVGHGIEVDRSNLKAHAPFDVIQAEDYDFHVNTEIHIADDPDDNSSFPREVAYIYATSELAYYEVDFERGANRVELRIGELQTATRPSRAGVVNIHLNSTQNEPFVSAIINYGREYHYVNVSQFLDPMPSGVQNVYFTFELDQLGYDIFNFNWFKFYKAYY